MSIFAVVSKARYLDSAPHTSAESIADTPAHNAARTAKYSTKCVLTVGEPGSHRRRGQLLEKSERRHELLLPSAVATARTCRIPTKAEEAAPAWQPAAVERGHIRLSIGKMPVLIEELTP